jgi:hypothetical protein
VQGRQLRRRCGRLGGQAVAPGFEVGQLGAQARGAVAVADRLDQVGDLAREGRKLSPAGLGRGRDLGAKASPFRVERADELLHGVRLHQLLAEGGEDLRLQVGPPHPLAVPAAVGAARRAAEVVFAQRCERSATAAAKHLARQQVTRPAAIPEPLLAALCGNAAPRRDAPGSQPGLNTVPEWLLDDAQLRHGLRDGFLRLVAMPHEDTGCRILACGSAAPGQHAGVGWISEQAVIVGRPAADGCVVPDAAGRAGDALLVEHFRDLERAEAAGKGVEDAPDDGGFLRHDLAQATF